MGGGMDIFWNHTFGTAIPPSCLVIADHLSARSLSVTWNVINFACKRGVGRQHTTFTSCQNAAFSNEFCLWRVDYALEGLVLIEQMWFFALISYCHGRTVPNVCLQRLSPFPFSLLAIFHPFPKQRACSQSTSRVAKGYVDRIKED